jgi:hypothetical protein
MLAVSWLSRNGLQTGFVASKDGAGWTLDKAITGAIARSLEVTTEPKEGSKLRNRVVRKLRRRLSVYAD